MILIESIIMIISIIVSITAVLLAASTDNGVDVSPSSEARKRRPSEQISRLYLLFPRTPAASPLRPSRPPPTRRHRGYSRENQMAKNTIGKSIRHACKETYIRARTNTYTHTDLHTHGHTHRHIRPQVSVGGRGWVCSVAWPPNTTGEVGSIRNKKERKRNIKKRK